MHKRISYAPPPSAASFTEESTASLNPQLGTVLFEGAVLPTKGVWLGVEWDDASRGKHSGVHEKTGVRYFETRVEGAGSFLRPDAKGIDRRGKTFKQALWSKYLDVDLLVGTTAPATSAQSPSSASATADEPTSQRYATNSNFDVEVVLTSKVMEHFKQLNRLREIGLEWESVSRASDPDGQVELEKLGKQLSRLEVLNLGYSMLPSLAEVEGITAVLPRLQHLALNSNRFARIGSPTTFPSFTRLTSLQLNSTLLSWSELRNFASSLSNLVELQFGFNRLRALRAVPDSSPRAPFTSTAPILPRLERLNLEGNELDVWEDIIEELASLPSLIELILAGNRFSSFTFPPTSSSAALRQLRHISLSDNLLSSWSTSIDVLAASASSVLPSLTSLRLSGNPIVSAAPRPVSEVPQRTPTSTDEDAERERNDDRSSQLSRLLVIARLPFLLELEGTAISPAERDDAERFWIERSCKNEENRVDVSDWARERLDKLRKKHGDAPAGSEPPRKEKSTLKDRLIRLRIRLDPSMPPLPPTASPEVSVLPTLRTLILRTQISRLVGTPLPKTKFKLVAVLQGGDQGKEVEVDIPAKEEGKEVSWWGLQDGDAVLVASL
ncbi:hypothetical protein JCM6882_006030 [Rhodosporidiobolus microsporus]